MTIETSYQKSTKELLRSYYSWVLIQNHQITTLLWKLNSEEVEKIKSKVYELESKITRRGLTNTLIMIHSLDIKDVSEQDYIEITLKINTIKEHFHSLHNNKDTIVSNMNYLLDSFQTLKKELFIIINFPI